MINRNFDQDILPLRKMKDDGTPKKGALPSLSKESFANAYTVPLKNRSIDSYENSLEVFQNLGRSNAETSARVAAMYSFAKNRVMFAQNDITPHLDQSTVEKERYVHGLNMTSVFVDLYEMHVGYKILDRPDKSNHEKMELLNAEKILRKSKPDTAELLFDGVREMAETGTCDLYEFYLDAKDELSQLRNEHPETQRRTANEAQREKDRARIMKMNDRDSGVIDAGFE